MPVILLSVLSLILACTVVVLIINREPSGNALVAPAASTTSAPTEDMDSVEREDTPEDSEKDTGDTLNPSASTMEDDGYDTPQEAVREYLNSMKDGDLGGMIGTFAIESYVDNYDFEAYLKSEGTYSPALYSLPVPSINEITRSLNLEQRRSRATGMLVYQYLLLNTDFDTSWLMSQYAVEDTDTFLSEFRDGLLADKTASIENITFPPLRDFLEEYGVSQGEDYLELHFSEQIQNYITQEAELLGVSEIESIVALLTIDGTEGYFCCDVGLYGDKWRIIKLSGYVGILFGLNEFNCGLSPDFFN